MLDIEEFVEVYTTQKDKLVALACRYVIPSDAEDIVQEAMLRAYRHRDKFKGESLVYTWLFRIVINTALNASKLKAGQPRYMLDIDDPIFQDSETLLELCNPQDILSAIESKQSILKAIQKMSIESKIVYGLWIAGFSYEDIAKIESIPVGTVRSRIHRLKQHIQEKVDIDDRIFKETRPYRD